MQSIALPHTHAAEMPWLFPKVNFSLFKIEAGEIGFDESSCGTPSDFMAMVQRDQTAAAHLLDALAAQGVAGGRDEPSGGRDEPSSASTLLVDMYDECIAALCDSPLTVGALEVMHSQVSCRKLSLDLTSGFVNHAILCLEEEEQEVSGGWHGVPIGLRGCVAGMTRRVSGIIRIGSPTMSALQSGMTLRCLPRNDLISAPHHPPTLAELELAAPTSRSPLCGPVTTSHLSSPRTPPVLPCAGRILLEEPAAQRRHRPLPVPEAAAGTVSVAGSECCGQLPE